MGAAFQEVLAGQLRASHVSRPVHIATRADATAKGATHVLHGYFVRRNGRIEVHGTLEDTGAIRTVKTLRASAPSLLAAANSLAKQIDPNAQPYAAADEAALRARAEKRAAVAPAEIEEILRRVRTERTAKRYHAAAAALREAVDLRPEEPLLWNELGYAEAFAGNLDAAVKALREYEDQSHGEANPLDSLGDVHYYFGRFSEADQFYTQAFETDSTFGGGASAYKAARARLMTGDVAGAGQLFRRFAETRRKAGDPLLDLREAQWNYLSGNTRGGEELALRFAAGASNPGAVSQTYAQLAVWRLAAGDTVRAREYAGRARSAAKSPGWRMLAGICAFLTEPPAGAAEWRQRALAQFSGLAGEAAGRYALAYALLLGRQFDAAIPVLRELDRTANPTSPEQIPVLLAWALSETGRIEEAAPLVEAFGIPAPGGESTFSFLSFPRIFQVRALVFEKQGKPEEAARSLDVYRKLGGAVSYSRPSSRS